MSTFFPERNWNIRVPGVVADDIRPSRYGRSTDAHQKVRLGGLFLDFFSYSSLSTHSVHLGNSGLKRLRKIEKESDAMMRAQTNDIFWCPESMICHKLFLSVVTKRKANNQPSSSSSSVSTSRTILEAFEGREVALEAEEDLLAAW